MHREFSSYKGRELLYVPACIAKPGLDKIRHPGDRDIRERLSDNA